MELKASVDVKNQVFRIHVGPRETKHMYRFAGSYKLGKHGKTVTVGEHIANSEIFHSPATHHLQDVIR